MSEAVFAIVVTLQRVRDGLRGSASGREAAELWAMFDEALDTLELTAGRRRLSTASLAMRVARLEEQLHGYSAGERRQIVCERLGISRSRYFQLRQSK